MPKYAVSNPCLLPSHYEVSLKIIVSKTGSKSQAGNSVVLK
jgi:hypothetical protein